MHCSVLLKVRSARRVSNLALSADMLHEQQKPIPKRSKESRTNYRAKKTLYEELFDQLLFKSEEESLEIIKRVRAGGGIRSILRQVQEGDLFLQLLSCQRRGIVTIFPFVRRCLDLYCACIYFTSTNGRVAFKRIIFLTTFCRNQSNFAHLFLSTPYWPRHT